MQISLAIITLNEEANIKRCIQSAAWVDDVVVLDSGSLDKTREIAKELGARVFDEEWRGFGPQKTRAVELCKNDWVLSLDADEALSPELSEYLKNLKESDLQSFDGIRFPRISFHLGRWINHGGWTPDYQLRFFNRSKAQWTQTHVHEHVTANSVKTVAPKIYHFPFKDMAAQITTNNRYSSLGAKDLLDSGKKFGVSKLVIKPISKFLETYIWKQGFRDGRAGFFISVGAAYSVFLKWAKLWELNQSSNWLKRQQDIESQFHSDT